MLQKSESISSSSSISVLRNVVIDDEARVNPAALRGAYEAFCKRRGLHAVDPRAFVVSLEGHGLSRHKSGSSRSWRGIAVGGGT